MKALLFVIIVYIPFFSSSQEHIYTFKLEGVESYQNIKANYDYVRTYLNVPERPYAFELIFNDEVDTFRIISTIDVTEEELRRYLFKRNLILQSFTKY
jgi:hypothetical protein